MTHYSRLIYTFLHLGALNELQYRTNFWVNLLQSLLGIGTALGAIGVVFLHTDTLGGWYPSELLTLVGIYFFVGGIIRSMIQPSMEAFLESVRRGTLDFILTKPEDAQLLVSLQRVSIWSTFDIVLGIGLVVYALTLSHITLQPGQVLTFLLLLFCGCVIVYCFWLLLATTAFWFIRVENILVIFQTMYQAGRWPVGIYPSTLRIVLTFIVPVAFAVTVPAEALIGRLTVTNAVLAVVLASGIFVASRLFWRFGLRNYSGASA